jgi:hypothetical protein
MKKLQIKHSTQVEKIMLLQRRMKKQDLMMITEGKIKEMIFK